MTRIRILAACLALAAGAATGTAAAAEPLQLGEAVAEALGSHPSVAISRSGRDAARAQLREARAAWLPRIEGSASAVRSDNPIFVFGSLLEQGRFAARHFDPALLNDPDPLANFRLAVSVRYTLFDQLRRLHAVRRAGNATRDAAAGEDEVRQRIRLEAISRYYGLLLAQERLNVAGEAVVAAEADAEAMRAREEEGVLVESDRLAAEVQLASFRQQRIEAEGALAIARAALATLMQRPLASRLAVKGTIPSRDFAAPPLDAAVGLALEQRGELRAAAIEIDNAVLQAATVRGSALPRVDAFAGWGSSSSRPGGGDPDHVAGLVVAIDLFDGGRPARIAASQAALAAARAKEAAARDRVRMEVVTAWYRARSANERIAVAASAAERAAAAARIVRDRHENGLTTITEQLRAQVALLTAQLEQLAARHDSIVGHAELLRSMGGLNDVEAFD